MEFVGVIEAKADPPGIDRARWLAVLSSRDDLVPPRPRQAVNPLTGEPATVSAPETSAELIVDGAPVGLIEWSETEENFLVAWGDPAVVGRAAEQVAADLDASFRVAADLERASDDVLTPIAKQEPWWKFW